MLKTNSPTAQLKELKSRVLNQEESEIVKGLLKADPKLCETYGNLHNLILGPALEYFDENSVQKLSIFEGLSQMRRSLMAEGSIPLEVIAIDQKQARGELIGTEMRITLCQWAENRARCSGNSTISAD